MIIKYNSNSQRDYYLSFYTLLFKKVPRLKNLNACMHNVNIIDIIQLFRLSISFKFKYQKTVY